MINFFQKSDRDFLIIQSVNHISAEHKDILSWLFSGGTWVEVSELPGSFVGPRREMITPWSTNAVEISQNCSVTGIQRIEEFSRFEERSIDPMLQQKYENPGQDVFKLDIEPAKIQPVVDIASYSEVEGLALSAEEISYLDGISEKIGRPLTDSEVFGFSQINSEHCRHKIFNGTFIIDGEEKELTLFQWIKKTSKDHPDNIVSAYKDNVAFIEGPEAEQFAPKTQDKPDYFETKSFESVISLKAETHNFPTTVEPFNGAATGAGGEIRDRLAGGQGSFPLAGTAVYMTSYPRTEKGRKWESNLQERLWLYQTPEEILIKASNGASDFGNKYGQPLIGGSLLTFEHKEGEKEYGFDKVIMLAGGVGFAKKANAIKKPVSKGEKVVVLGGDNYRIGMGGGAVSSVATGEFDNSLELNAVQRSNPEMQKRVANAVRALSELDENPITSIHDHGAGGHLNCLSELVEDSGGQFDLKKFAIGDPTLSSKEVLSNESQERMGLVIPEEHIDYLKDVSDRERAPFNEVGTAGDDQHLQFEDGDQKPFDLELDHLFGSSPKTILNDTSQKSSFSELNLEGTIVNDIHQVLQLEAVACKDWLTNKVDRSVTGKVATQQTVGAIQLPLNNVAVMALDFKSNKGVATSIGHAPIAALIDSEQGSRLSVAEAMTNLVFTPLSHGLKGVSLSANWMWPAKNDGENARLYKAVQALSEFCSAIGVNVPTGKDSLSMTQKYPDGKKVFSPGTVIISSVGEVSDIRKTVLPALDTNGVGDSLVHIDFAGGKSHLGGSSFAQSKNKIGSKSPDVEAGLLTKSFVKVQELVKAGKIKGGHDISSGGMITSLLEMCFPNESGGMSLDFSSDEEDLTNILFSEKPGIIVQVDEQTANDLTNSQEINATYIGLVDKDRNFNIKSGEQQFSLDIDECRKVWMKSSNLLEQRQSREQNAHDRFANFSKQPLVYEYPALFNGSFEAYGINPNRTTSTGIRAAIIREKGVNGDREMAYSLWLAGFDVKDVHMTDLVSGREDLSDVNMIVFVGGFSNSDVLGSAKGWAGSFLFNPKAKKALDAFYDRQDTLSLGVCNGCQVMMELEKVYPGMNKHPKMHHNESGKFESAFVNVDVLPNESIMFGSLSNSRLGIWLAHGEGRFQFDGSESDYVIPVKFSYDKYPGNPNGSDYSAAALASKDGRHVAIMPHLERTIFPWNWAHTDHKLDHEVSPWIEPFVNARNWVSNKINK